MTRKKTLAKYLAPKQPTTEVEEMLVNIIQSMYGYVLHTQYQREAFQCAKNYLKERGIDYSIE